jgi:hypothetical protein
VFDQPLTRKDDRFNAPGFRVLLGRFFFIHSLLAMITVDGSHRDAASSWLVTSNQRNQVGARTRAGRQINEGQRMKLAKK